MTSSDILQKDWRPAAKDADAVAAVDAVAAAPPCPAIRISGVRKAYRLYTNPREMVLDHMGLYRLRFWKPAPIFREFEALAGVDLLVNRAERVGIVGRNGAGKTTLLKLITKNFEPTTGTVVVNGEVQALMQTGLGFHPEFTGQHNIRASLQYNGLIGEALEAAFADVIEFVELGEFLEQPVKTYSAGMAARLQFATATALKPDILIIDEILGAGDAYFAAKCAARMERLAASGCTLLLVSHSMQQVLQFCERAVWLESGCIAVDGSALAVVKSYEEYIRKLEWEAARAAISGRKTILADADIRNRLLEEVIGEPVEEAPPSASANADLCEPGPPAEAPPAPRAVSADDSAFDGKAYVSEGGISRWPGEPGLKICNVSIVDDQGSETAVVAGNRRVSFAIDIVAETGAAYSCRYVIFMFTSDGNALTRHCSDWDSFFLEKGEQRRAIMEYDPLLLGNGEYVFSAAIYKHLDLSQLSATVPYDVLARSFQFRVIDHYPDDPTLFHHPSAWRIAGAPGEHRQREPRQREPRQREHQQ